MDGFDSRNDTEGDVVSGSARYTLMAALNVDYDANALSGVQGGNIPHATMTAAEPAMSDDRSINVPFVIMIITFSGLRSVWMIWQFSCRFLSEMHMHFTIRRTVW